MQAQCEQMSLICANALTCVPHNVWVCVFKIAPTRAASLWYPQSHTRGGDSSLALRTIQPLNASPQLCSIAARPEEIVRSSLGWMRNSVAIHRQDSTTAMIRM